MFLCYTIRAIQEAIGNVSLEIISDILAEYIKFRILNIEMIAKIIVMDEITKIECILKKRERDGSRS